MTGHEHALRPTHHDHDAHDAHDHDAHDHASGSRAMALSATLHCLTGCAVGEILGLVIGTAAGLATLPTIGLSVALAFVFGYLLSTLPLLRAGLAVRAALGVVLAADTLSIASMEVTDNLVVAVIPGAMDAGLVNPTFWTSMALSLVAAFAVAFPVNAWLLRRGRGHALTHQFHGRRDPGGARRLIPDLPSGALAAAIAAFLLGGLLVSLAERWG